MLWAIPFLHTSTPVGCNFQMVFCALLQALAMEPPAHYPSVCKKALQMVLTLLRKQETLDTVRFRYLLALGRSEACSGAASEQLPAPAPWNPPCSIFHPLFLSQPCSALPVSVPLASASWTPPSTLFRVHLLQIGHFPFSLSPANACTVWSTFLCPQA